MTTTPIRLTTKEAVNIFTINIFIVTYLQQALDGKYTLRSKKHMLQELHTKAPET